MRKFAGYFILAMAIAASLHAAVTYSPPDDPTGLELTLDELYNTVLRWNLNSETSVVGYNVYRASNLDSLQWFRLNQALVTETTFTDTVGTEVGEFLLFYYVTAVNTWGMESIAAPNSSTCLCGDTYCNPCDDSYCPYCQDGVCYVCPF